MQQPNFFCREASLAAHEPLYGTAAHTRLWIVLEARQAWGPKGLEDSGLPLAVVERLSAFTAKQPLARVQLVRTPERTSGPLRLMLARSDGPRSKLVDLWLDGYDALQHVDLDAFANGGELPDACPIDEPRFLVCVHGKRDRCCAQQGMPVFNALSARLGLGQVFQTTHLGGHRFAATLVVLPSGLCYGRVEASEVDALIAAHAAGEIYDLERLRGRSNYAPSAQAAEFFFRMQHRERRIDALALEAEEPSERGVRVWLRDGSGARHAVEVETRALAPIAASCGADPKKASCFVLTSSR
jgi:hypothetical protein